MNCTEKNEKVKIVHPKFNLQNNCKMQYAKCYWLNATCKMQYAKCKCKMQKAVAQLKANGKSKLMKYEAGWTFCCSFQCSSADEHKMLILCN